MIKRGRSRRERPRLVCVPVGQCQTGQTSRTVSDMSGVLSYSKKVVVWSIFWNMYAKIQTKVRDLRENQ